MLHVMVTYITKCDGVRIKDSELISFLFFSLI